MIMTLIARRSWRNPSASVSYRRSRHRAGKEMFDE